MCGIAGIVRFDGQGVPAHLLKAMTDQLAHRGPDGEGLWSAGSVGLGHRRLAIIDVAGSPQPMTSGDGRHHVCFNGEIFNYRQLRRELGYPFRTDGDTEVLLAVYAAEGADGVKRLRGQFAYALHDEPRGTTWLFRDRLGVLPLYYYVDDEHLLFASEIKSLLVALPHSPRVDTASIADYLSRRAVASPYTLFEGIRKLPPGHRLRVHRDGRSVVEPYWSLPEPGDVLDVTGPEAKALVRSALDDAVADGLVADVPVGAYLSGGVDSSLIVATATRLRGGEPVETFSAGFGDERFDELQHARRVSGWLGTNHHEVLVRADDFVDDWSRLTWHRDAPVSEPADVAVSRLAREARTVVKVVLSGEGSDELFAGYPKHRFARWSERAGIVPAAIRTPVLSRMERALPSGHRRLRVAMRALAAGTAAERTEAWFSPFTAYEREALLRDVAARDVSSEPAGRDALDRMLRQDLRGGWLADNLLERGDRMSMAASLELRPPFLDHRLVELACRLPTRVKLRGGVGKWVVRELAGEALPDDIVRRPKSGFIVPLDAWFRGALRDRAYDQLLAPGSIVADLLDRSTVQRILEDHTRGRRDEAVRIWTLMCLETWHATFFGPTRRTPAYGVKAR